MSRCGTSEDGGRESAVAHVCALIGAIAVSFAIVAPLSYRAHETMGLWAAAILTMVTGYDYLRAGLKHITEIGTPAEGKDVKAAKPAGNTG